MDKILTFSSRSEQGVFAYAIDTESPHLIKTAGEYHPTVADYIRNAKPIAGQTQLLLTALGAGEYWGANRNGDYFPEAALAHEGDTYGYRTFLTNAKLFRHHVNKPTSPSYGKVVLSVYNPIFHRVELVVLIDHASAPDLVDKINAGESLEFSMGCKVPYDVCSICGNKAPSRAQYCEHAKYYLGRLDPQTGKQVFVYNHQPRFFDISYVLIGADKIAKSLLKVASAGNAAVSSAHLAEKVAERTKAAEIKKVIPVSPDTPPASQDSIMTLLKSIPEFKARERAIPRETLNHIAKNFPLSAIMTTMTAAGILPKPQEFQRIVIIRLGRPDVADELDRRGICFDPNSDVEPALDKVDMGHRQFDARLFELLRPLLAERSYAWPHFGPRIVRLLDAREQPLPTLIKIGEDSDRTPVSAKIMLPTAAALYAVLAARAPGVVNDLGRIALSNPGLAASLGIGAIAMVGAAFGAHQRGQYSGGQDQGENGNPVLEHIERMRSKPYEKVASMGADGGLAAAARRLFLYAPLAYMGSGVLQKHREINPYEEEGAMRKFLRTSPDLVTGLLAADAVLSAQGKGTHQGLKLVSEPAKALGGKFWSKIQPTLKAVSALGQGHHPHFAKVASAQEFLSSSVIWPLAMGKVNLPGRIIGGALDQGVLELSSQMLERRARGKQARKED